MESKIVTDLTHFTGLISLCRELRSERLLMDYEQSVLRNLIVKIREESEQIGRNVWICRHQQEILKQLINSNPSVSPENCFQLMCNLSSSVFVEAYKVINQYAAELVQIYKMLVTKPEAVAIFLNSAEKITTSYSIDELCSSIFNFLYGSCFFPQDEKIFLELLGYLIKLQLVQNPEPRKLIRKGNTVFAKMYKLFSETLITAKVFLTAALHDPIMFLLSQDDLFLDIDPSKSPIRIPATERCRRFGCDENSDSYRKRVALHRKVIVDKLVAVVERFITSILNAMQIFPATIIWLIGQIHSVLIENKHFSNEASLVCTDLIFTYFICSAIISPEPFGIISDTPISYIARFNLMQIGQILQTIAILPYEQQFPNYFNEILSRLDKESITNAVSKILNTKSVSIETLYSIQVADLKGNEILQRSEFVGTLYEINILQTYLKSTAIKEITNIVLLKELMDKTKRLPEKFDVGKNFISSATLDHLTPNPEKKLSSIRLRNLADKVQTVALRNHQRLMQTSSVSNLRNFHQRDLIYSSSANLLSGEMTQNDIYSANASLEIQDASSLTNNNSLVLIFAISEFDLTTTGMASEEEIFSSQFKKYCDPGSPYIDYDNLTKCQAFLDTKRKLRFVLSCFITPFNNFISDVDIKKMTQSNGGDQKILCNVIRENKVNSLEQILKLLLAEAINNGDRKLTAQIREVQRCLSIFDANGIDILLQTMERDQHERTVFTQYLQQSRLTLLHFDYYLQQMSKRIQRDKELTLECLVEILVRFSLREKDQFLKNFVHDFQLLNVQDEKIDFVESNFRRLCESLVVEPIWRYATLENIEYARRCLERSLMSHIYTFALFPNADADYYRDEILSKSIQQLSIFITVDHPDLAISKNLVAECPWPSAQAELGIINAYKSPRDKMACILRCCETIENLIILSSTHTTVSADDILPVLIFVIIKANPPALLSNLQFIDSFYAKRMQGCEAYWWVQFNSAVEFLKTLLNKLCS